MLKLAGSELRYRVIIALVLALTAGYLLLDKFPVRGAVIALLHLAILAWNWNQLIKRARRAMGKPDAGMPEVALWAFRNGDLAIRLGYVFVFYAFILVISTFRLAIHGPDFSDIISWGERNGHYVHIGLNMLLAAMLLRCGHLAARDGNGHDWVAWVLAGLLFASGLGWLAGPEGSWTERILRIIDVGAYLTGWSVVLFNWYKAVAGRRHE